MSIKGKIGFSIRSDIERTDPDVLQQLKEIGTCALSDAMKNFNTMHHSIKPIDEKIRFSGNAITVRMRSADNLMLHKAIGLAKAGDIIVVDTYGSESNSIFGEMMATAAKKVGVAGIVIDGGIRDILELKRMRAPVFYKCITPAVGDQHGPGEINFPISCGGVAVNPGDIIVGDANGIVVIQKEIANDVLLLAREKIEQDEKWHEEIMKGIITKPDVDEDLKRSGII